MKSKDVVVLAVLLLGLQSLGCPTGVPAGIKNDQWPHGRNYKISVFDFLH